MSELLKHLKEKDLNECGIYIPKSKPPIDPETETQFRIDLRKIITVRQDISSIIEVIKSGYILRRK